MALGAVGGGEGLKIRASSSTPSEVSMVQNSVVLLLAVGIESLILGEKDLYVLGLNLDISLGYEFKCILVYFLHGRGRKLRVGKTF